MANRQWFSFVSETDISISTLSYYDNSSLYAIFQLVPPLKYNEDYNYNPFNINDQANTWEQIWGTTTERFKFLSCLIAVILISLPNQGLSLLNSGEFRIFSILKII